MSKPTFRVVALAMAAGLASLPFAAQADDRDEFRFEITPFGGYRFGGEFEETDSGATVDVEDDASFGLIFSGRDTSNTQWEVIYSRQEATADTDVVPSIGPATGIDIQYLQLGGTYQGDWDFARPYLAATFGGAHLAPDLAGLDSDTFWSFSIGTGLQFWPRERFGLRLEARAFGTLMDSDTDLFCVSDAAVAGCGFRIEGKVFWQIETSAGFVFRF